MSSSEREMVQLAVYDLSRGLARSMSLPLVGKQIDGIWHTGIIAWGKEFFFSGGIQEMKHEHFVHGWANNLPPERIIDLGATEVGEAQFKEFLKQNSHRFTAQTYNLFTWNCNNFSDECAKFLLGKAIPDYITSLPQEVLNSPIGTMIRPVMEQMALGGSGGSMDPLARASRQGHATAAEGAASPAPVSPALLPDMKGPLLSDDVSAIPQLAERLRGYLKDSDKQEILAASISVLSSGEPAPLPPNTLSLLRGLLEQRVADFAVLCVSRIAVLHASQSDEQVQVEAEELTSHVLSRLTRAVDHEMAFSPPAQAMALCLLSNHVGKSPHRCRFSTTFSRFVDVALQMLGTDRKDVKQFAAALLANCSLALLVTEKAGQEDGMPDESVHILMGALEGIGNEQEDIVQLRRLLSVSRILESSPLAHALALECGLDCIIENFASKLPSQSSAARVAREVLVLLQRDVSHCDDT